jgi:eukaryotic-like serine/threonine-protein kinase
MVTVPDVVGKDEDEAVRLLKAAGLDVTVRRIFFTGSVFSQSVDGGEQAAKGSSITIWVR